MARLFRSPVAIHEDVEELRNAKMPDDSLFPLFQPHLIDMKDIKKKGYGSVLVLVQNLIGLQPTCDMVLEIYPPAFECYNLVVPNLLNLPHMLLGVAGAAPKKLVSIAMYASSRGNGCSYCSSHCASFAARRGVDPQVLRSLLDEVASSEDATSIGDDSSEGHEEGDYSSSSHRGDFSTSSRQGSSRSVLSSSSKRSDKRNGKSSKKKKKLTPEEKIAQRQAVVKVAYGLGTVPVSVQAEDIQELYQVMSAEHVEWIVAATAMFGSFNKYMDGLGIPLEGRAYAETVGLMDDKYDPGKAGSMLSKTVKAKAGSPHTATETSASSDSGEEEEGPALPPQDDWKLKVSCIYQGLRPGGALALDGKLHGDTPHNKLLCMKYLQKHTGSDFASVLEPLQHVRIIRALTAIIRKNTDPKISGGCGVGRKVFAGMHFCKALGNTGLEEILKEIQAKFPPENNFGGNDGPMTRLLVKVTDALSFTPNRVTPELVQQLRTREALVSPAMLVEMVSFLACIQMLHRIQAFYQVRDEAASTSGEEKFAQL